MVSRDYALEFEVKVKSPLRDLRECLTEAIKDRDCRKELLATTVEDYDEIKRTYEAELATLKAELERRSPVPLTIIGKFKPRLAELTSFKPKLLIRFITNKPC